MQFCSTRDIRHIVSYEEAIFRGLAPDGGLYHPVKHPDLQELFASLNPGMDFTAIAGKLITALFPDYFDKDKAKEIAEKAFPFSPELVHLDNKLYLLELFHGPSCAFKDFGASFLATCMEEFLKQEHRKAVILTATSGDTGSAVAQAFYKKENIDVVILYPSGRVSPLQEKQLTTLGANIHALEVKGSFDDCQRMVKEAFMDTELRSTFNLTSANSINLGRLIPQSFYYVYAYAQLKDTDKAPVFCVPSGNFGNLTAGVYASIWGMPTSGFIAATNANDVVPQYLAGGEYKPRPSLHTLSNAMDVGNPSNFERLKALFGSREKMAEHITGCSISDKETLETISRYHKKKQTFLDPHTAVGVLASERYMQKNPAHNIISLSTAHPGKFLEVVKQATGEFPPLPDRLKEALNKQKQATLIDNSLDSLSDFLRKKIK
ncbi:threonine synthase [Spirochaetia bacterium 38H-sp]|uniref:Threonine synthase n=1 Tax=Rarispira pelagica TaxID=3141764 RepID=A0ABU9U913_9SPIR